MESIVARLGATEDQASVKRSMQVWDIIISVGIPAREVGRFGELC